MTIEQAVDAVEEALGPDWAVWVQVWDTKEVVMITSTGLFGEWASRIEELDAIAVARTVTDFPVEVAC